MTWRREDYGYAAATVAAVVFVAYLIAGNFGLVPSPLGHGQTDGLPQAQVAAIAVSNSTSGTTLPVPAVAAAPVPVHRVARSDKPAAFGPPSVVIDTKSGSSVTLAQKAPVVGRVLASAGVKDVLVRFISNSGVTTALASTQCTNGLKCSWSVAIPGTIGTYHIMATAEDRAGRTASSNTITLTVVNTGNVVGGVVQGVGSAVSGVGTVVGNAPTLLGNVVNNLVGLLHL